MRRTPIASKCSALSLAIALALAAVGEPRAAAACSCRAQPVAQLLQQADLVVEAQVTAVAVERSLHRRTAHLRVTRAWKGATSGEGLTVVTVLEESMCGVEFARGGTYLVFATLNGRAYSTSLCAGSGTTADRAAQIAELTRLAARPAAP